MLLFPDRMKYREFRVIFFLPTLFYLYLAEISLSCGLPWLPIVELLYICLYLKIQLDLDLKLDTCLLKELQIMWLFCCCSSLSHMWTFATLRTAARRASIFVTISQSLLKLMSIELVMPSKHLVLCHPLLLLPSIFSSIRIFSNESALCIRWPKYWSFSISLSKEYSGLISFRIDWLDLPAVQGTLKSILQHHSSKASIIWHSPFMGQLSHPHMTIGKTIALTRWAFVGKVMSLLFNMLSRLVTAFLPRNKCLLISWLQMTSAVIL